MAHSPTINASEMASVQNPTLKAPVSGRTAAIRKQIRAIPSQLRALAIGMGIQALAFWKGLRELHPRLKALAIGMVVLALAYWPNFHDLYESWHQPNYSHGFFVIPIALWIFSQRLKDSRIDWQASRVPWWSWIPLVVVLATRSFAYERNSQWSETATLVPAVVCLILALGGWRLLQVAWPAAAYLLFMLPLPVSANGLIALPLQRLATVGSVFVMQLLGLWAIAAGDGNVITLPNHLNQLQTLEVAQACNGLSMLMTLAATVTATVILFPMKNWKRIVLLASAIPIALVSNIARIVATGMCYYYFEAERVKKDAHDWSGWMMMPLALILVGLELFVLSWLADDDIQSSPEPTPKFVPATYPVRTYDKKKPSMPGDDELA